MNAKDLERLLASHGANPSGVAVVVQKLRESFKVSVGGRGFSAHDLTADEMACIVAAYVGSEVAARASETLARVIELRSADVKPNRFIDCFQLILLRDIKGLGRKIEDVREIRIARNAGFAQIIFNKGTPWTFTNRRVPAAALPAFRSEGVLSASLIDLLAENVFLPEDRDDGPPIEADDE